MPMFRYSPPLWHCIVLTSVVFVISACAVDTSRDEESRQLKRAGAAYTGPQYSIGIVQFSNKITTMPSGAGEGAAGILKAQLDAAGLNAILLDENALKEANTRMTQQRAGIVKIAKSDIGSGVDALDYHLSGTITSYSESEEDVDTILSRKKSIVAHVTLDYSLVDITTGKLLASSSASGGYRRTGSGALLPGATSSLDPGLRDGALRDALAKATVSIIHKLGSMPFQGKLQTVDGPSLVFKAGRRSQLKEGTQLAAYRISKALIDPDNGQVLGYRESKLGVIQLSSHQNETLSTATVVSGTGFQAGDVVRLIP